MKDKAFAEIYHGVSLENCSAAFLSRIGLRPWREGPEEGTISTWAWETRRSWGSLDMASNPTGMGILW